MNRKKFTRTELITLMTQLNYVLDSVVPVVNDNKIDNEYSNADHIEYEYFVDNVKEMQALINYFGFFVDGTKLSEDPDHFERELIRNIKNVADQYDMGGYSTSDLQDFGIYVNVHTNAQKLKDTELNNSEFLMRLWNKWYDMKFKDDEKVKDVKDV